MDTNTTPKGAAFAAGLRAAFHSAAPLPPSGDDATEYMDAYEAVAYDPVADAVALFDRARRTLHEVVISEACRIAPDAVAEVRFEPDLADPAFACRFSGARNAAGEPVVLPADVFETYARLAPHLQDAHTGHLSLLFEKTGFGGFALHVV